MNRRSLSLVFTLLLALTAVSAALSVYNLRQLLPFDLWFSALRQPNINDVNQMMFHYSTLPRVAVALLAGASLGLVGLLFQQVLRNPLAEPATLGVSAGAQLGLTVSILWALPGGELTQQFAAMFGAVVVGLVVFGIAWGKRMSPVTLILAGLVVGLYCGAVNGLFGLFNYQSLQSLYMWNTGSLNQQDWSVASFLLPRLIIVWILAFMLQRPLTLLGLDDGVAKNLGLGLTLARLSVLTLAILMSAQVVNAVGIIGFIGLFAPLLAKMLGARRLTSRLVLAPLIGALLLWLTDQIMQYLTQVWMEIPTGAATALVGAPLLLWLLPRLRNSMTPPRLDQGDHVPAERQHLVRWVGLALLLLAVGIAVALMVGRDATSWTFSTGASLESLLPWRTPRVIAALAAGVMLASAGVLIQKLTGNAMASPEVLGISSGAAFGVILMLFIVPGDAFVWLLPAGSAGAAVTLLVILVSAGLKNFSAERMLLTGIALSTAFTTLMSLLLASGDPRMGGLLTWISGSTYSVTMPQAWRTALIALVLVGLVPFCRRWVNVLPLGSVTAKSVGIALTPSRTAILLLASIMTAAATLTVGPMSFVGLMAPHMARMLGFRRAIPQWMVASIMGGLLMVFADWCGRMVIFPDQIPAGLLATFIGAPYFIYLLRKQGQSK